MRSAHKAETDQQREQFWQSNRVYPFKAPSRDIWLDYYIGEVVVCGLVCMALIAIWDCWFA